MAGNRRIVLFTAQEPSGDAHAAPVIARLRAHYRDIEPVAWGGPKMEAAGATMLGRTADDGVMGLAGISKVAEVKRLHDKIVEWARSNPVAVHMPVDSPSANYPLCARLKPMGTRVVNLVAPQLWAWAPWRIGKVRRLSDALLCLLPFEEEWFRARGVVAKFVGHPVLSEPLEETRVQLAASCMPQGAPRIVILPGSRSAEVRKNARLLIEVFEGIRARHPSAVAVTVASSEANAERFRQVIGRDITGHTLVVSNPATSVLEGAIRWADLALACSGTVSLDCTRQARAVIGVYRTTWIEATLARLVVWAPNLLLPNILAGKRIVPEFVPYAGTARPIVAAATEILERAEIRSQVESDLSAVRAQFLDRDPAVISAEVAATAARGGSVTNEFLDEVVRASRA